MDFTRPDGRARYDALVAAADATVIGLDFDGVLAPIVDDPARARIHPGAAEVLVGLAAVVRCVAVITGRPADQAIALGDLDEVGLRMAGAGGALHIFGQYGNERWSTATWEVSTPPPPPGLAAFRDQLPQVLRAAGAEEAFVEEKGLAIAVHTRRLADPAGALERLSGPIREVASAHGLALEPGRQVIEVRAPGMHKGRAVRTLAEEVDAGGFLFAGDDLGDIEAFEAVEWMRSERGIPTLLVHSDSDEQHALRSLADVVVPGPHGVLDLLDRFARDARTHGASRDPDKSLTE